MNNAARVPRGPGKAGSIVVVDDEIASGELVAALLRSQGYGVRVLTDGRACVELVRAGGVDLLVLDLMMSKLDGVEVCTLIRGELRDLTLPIVITTSLQDRESRLRAKEAGADDVLVKPIDGLELLLRIESLLRARAYVVELGRERDLLRSELSTKNKLLERQAVALGSWVETRALVEQLLDEQSALIAGARARWSEVREARDQITRFAELGAKVRLVLDGSSGTDGDGSPRSLDALEAGATPESCGNPRSASK